MQKHEFLGMVDPCTGSFKKVLYPEYVKNQSTYVHPLNWKDSLAILIQSPGEHPNPIVDMYWLDEKSEIWTKIYTMGPYYCFEGEYGFRIPQSLTTGEIVIEAWKGTCLNQRTPYFWSPKISESVIYVSEFDTLRPLWYESYSHVESLVCVKGMELIGKEDKNKKKTKRAKNWTELLSKDFESLLHLH
ncbi:hypothetical protein POM88_028668 [Heracleum sosnowskyi]|uniref:Uncharacterized protein n=1 Tax=Heracleum sosnowskyi TaxID=360622 RepID=A0AAD8HUS9_9APIA|nr:hypothetical protein POM88_028668 [Heracleum sosnowskyi]